MHERYGIDLDDPQVRHGRSWRWLRIRLQGLLELPPAFLPDGTPCPSTRIGFALFPPTPSASH